MTPSLEIGNGNWAVKSDSLLGYKEIDGEFFPREIGVTRATTATRINEDGLVELTPYNLLTWSEEFNNVVWSKVNSTITVNLTTAPDGNLTADSLMEDSSTVLDHYIRNTTFGSFNNSLTYSIYLKENGRRYVQLATVTGQGVFRPVFDLQDGIYVGNVGTNTGATADIESVGDGWYRCIVMLPSNTTNLNQVTIILQNSATYQVYTGDPTKGIYIWGAQLNEGTLKDYLPTTDRLDIARIDYSSGEGALLVEPQRTNLLTYSEQFDNADWSKISTTITENTTTAPNGILTADTMSVTSNTSRILNTVVYSSGTYTISVWMKTTSVITSGSMRFYLVVDGVSIIIPFTPTTEWQRFEYTFTANTSITSIQFRGNTFVGDVAIWGAQLELGAYPTSYIPTTSASVTRNADVVSMTNASAYIGQTEGTIFVDFILKNPISATNRIISITESNWLSGGSIRLDVYSNQIAADFVNGGSSMGGITYYSTILQNVRYKVAIAYKENDCKMYINGIDAGSDTSTSAMPTCSELHLNYLGGGFNAPYEASNIKAVSLYKERLSNAELATLTTI